MLRGRLLLYQLNIRNPKTAEWHSVPLLAFRRGDNFLISTTSNFKDKTLIILLPFYSRISSEQQLNT